MTRKTFDRLVSAIGLALVVLLITAGGLLTWAHSFVHDEVHTQLAAQQIFFPPAGSSAIAAPEFAQMRQYAGQQLVTGAQAKTYADHFIAVHLQEIGGGKTYVAAQFSGCSRIRRTRSSLRLSTPCSRARPCAGCLLNAYAFDTVGDIAGIAAWVCFIGAAVMLALAGLGLVARASRRGRADAVRARCTAACSGWYPS